MLKPEIKTLTLPLKYSWALSRGTWNSKTNIFIRITGPSGAVGYGEAAPNARYGESPESLVKEFGAISALIAEVSFLDQLHSLFDKFNVYRSLRFAIESAFIHLKAAEKDLSVPAFLGLPEVPTAGISTAYTIPVMPAGEVEAFAEAHALHRFATIKVKLSNTEAAALFNEVCRVFPRHKIMADGNEAWTKAKEVMQFFDNIDSDRLLWLEQPLPAAEHDEQLLLKKNSPVKLLADESVIASFDADFIASRYHCINVKLMKAGGYIPAIQMLKDARAAGLSTMVGCMTETGLAISSGMYISSLADMADLDGSLYLQDEPTGMVVEKSGRLFIRQYLPENALWT